jgi:hypothetical protein
MTMRSSRTVTFGRPFVLGDLKQTFPPGDYRVETGEELIEGTFFPVFKRRRTVIYLHQETTDPEHSEVMVIDPRELDDALHNDRAAVAERDALTDRTRRGPKDISQSRTFDRKAIDRAENEGMSLLTAKRK